MATFLLGLLVILLLTGVAGLTPRQLALRKEYLRLVRDARILLLRYSVRDWPKELAKWQFVAKCAPWLLLRYLARLNKRRLGGMGSLGDVVLFRSGKADQEANDQLLEIVRRLHSVSSKIAE